MSELSGIPHQLSCVVGGRKWDLFSARYATPDGTFEFYFYAISFEHAEYVIEEIKKTAEVTGQVVGVSTK